jgi:hypothetical protein
MAVVRKEIRKKLSRGIPMMGDRRVWAIMKTLRETMMNKNLQRFGLMVV